MSENTALKTPGGREEAPPQTAEPALLPPVDIYEDAAALTLIADLPGVPKERLSVEVDQGTLVIEGTAEVPIPEGTEALYTDLPTTRYRRSFTLSAELEPERIEAQMQDGVLTLRVPKRAEVQPRKIQINAG